MRNNKVFTLVALISICFNIFFAAGFLVARHALRSLKTPEGKVNLAIRILKLNAQQAQDAQRLFAEFTRQTAPLKQFSQADKDLFWQEVVKENPDQDKIQKILEETAPIVQEYRVKSVAFLQGTMKILDTKQKARLVSMLKDKEFFGK